MFYQPYACVRASPLTKKYGWGVHYDGQGKIAIHAVDSQEYRRFVEDQNIKKETERFDLKGKVFYLHTPEGIGRSKLAANAEKLLGVSMTSRNWRTVCKIVEVAKA